MSKAENINVRREEKVKVPKYNKETIEIMEEAKKIKDTPKDYRAFNNVKALVDDLNKNM